MKNNLANWLTGSRLLAGPLLLAAAALGWRTFFLVVLAAALVSDAVDGWLARRRNQTSALGARLDSWADLGVAICGVLGGTWLWTEVVRREAAFVGLFFASWLLPVLFSLIKYRRIPSYHSRLAKLAAIVAGPSALVLLGGGSTWFFRIASLVVLVEAAEETVMTAVLPSWHANVSGLRRALEIRRAERGGRRVGAPTLDA